MGIGALTHRDDGTEIKTPESPEDWSDWVSAGRTRNWMLDDPLLDWLQLYGQDHDYIPKVELDAYDPALDFGKFIFEKGRAFEAKIMHLLQARRQVAVIAQDYQDVLRLDKARDTFELMVSGTPVIYQPVLRDAHNRTYGAPDFLMRSDVLFSMFPAAIPDKEREVPAPGLNASRWHYRVIDTKFTTLHLNADGTELTNQGGARAYKAQLFVYNRMLGRLQGYEPPVSYLLGRGWERTQSGQTHRGFNALELLAPVPQAGLVASQAPLSEAVERAIEWVRQVRTEGRAWKLLPQPSVPELYPNMGNTGDVGLVVDSGAPELEPGSETGVPEHHWVNVKGWLAEELKELTQLWRVGVGGRKTAHRKELRRWDSPGLTPQAVGVTGTSSAPTLERILAINTDETGPPVQPARIEATRNEWMQTPGLEFYVDFEFCNDLNDDFSRLPEKGGQPLIFMIGCGHLEAGVWQFASFTADRLTEQEELRVIREWVYHMGATTKRLIPYNDSTRIIHWSNAEVYALDRDYNSARARHGASTDWPELNWYDFLVNVMRREPVVVRGALGFGLKAIANAMRSRGLIETDWADSPIDGLGAMVGAWRCDEEAEKRGVSMTVLPLMREIARYNEVDCRVMMEIVRYLRENH